MGRHFSARSPDLDTTPIRVRTVDHAWLEAWRVAEQRATGRKPSFRVLIQRLREEHEAAREAS
jgi:hypothetical protein